MQMMTTPVMHQEKKKYVLENYFCLMQQPTVCVKNHFESIALQISLTVTVLSCLLFASHFQAKSIIPLLLWEFFLSFNFFLNMQGSATPPLPPHPTPRQGICSSKNDFSATTLMRTSHRFHSDSHKTVKFFALSKNLAGCVLQLSKAYFQTAHGLPSKVNPPFLVNSAGFVNASIQTLSFTMQNMHCWIKRAKTRGWVVVSCWSGYSKALCGLNCKLWL